MALSDDIISCVDAARKCKADLGFVSHRTYLVTVSWDGGRVGAGSSSAVETEITPSPQAVNVGLDGRLRPWGIDEEGFVLLSGITRTLTEAQLWSPAIDRDTRQFFYKLVGTRAADGQRDRYYVPTEPPVLNPGGKKGLMLANCWTVRLRRAEGP